MKKKDYMEWIQWMITVVKEKTSATGLHQQNTFLLIKVEDIHSIQLMSSASCDSRPNWAIFMAELRRQGTLFRIEYYARTPESPLRGVFWQNVALCGLSKHSSKKIPKIPKKLIFII